jgi:hypothetical protein
MPKLALILVLAVLSSAVQATSQGRSDSAPFKTAGYCNGRFWKLLDDEAKLNWIEAYSDGVTFAVMGIYISSGGDTGASSATRAKIDSTSRAKLDSFFPSGLTWGEVRTALDRFYDSPENGPIPVPSAVQVLTMKVAGVQQSAIDKRISYIRRVAIEALQDSGER